MPMLDAFTPRLEARDPALYRFRVTAPRWVRALRGIGSRRDLGPARWRATGATPASEGSPRGGSGSRQGLEVAEQGRLAAHRLLRGELVVGVAEAHAPERLAVGPLFPRGIPLPGIPSRIGLITGSPGLGVHVGGVAGVEAWDAVVPAGGVDVDDR